MSTRWRILAVLFFARISMAIQFQAVAALSPVIAAIPSSSRGSSSSRPRW
jgi:hypothetical protein